MAKVRSARARIHEVALLHRQSLKLYQHARGVACKLGLALDTRKARACDQRMVSVLPLPILVDSPYTTAWSESGTSSPSSSSSSSPGLVTPSPPLVLSICPTTADCYDSDYSLLSPLELGTVMLSPEKERSAYSAWRSSQASNVKEQDSECAVVPARISSCKRKPSVSFVPRNDAHLPGKRVKLQIPASC